MSTLEQTLFIATCIILFFAGFISKEYSEEALMREYEGEIEWQNQKYDALRKLHTRRQ